MMRVMLGDIIIYPALFISLYFEVFLLITFLEKYNAQKGVPQEAQPEIAPEQLPSVSVIVPCWNEETTVAGTLRSLLALEYPKEKLHIYAVDDGSTDNTLEHMRTFEHEPNVTIITKENGGKHSAMNAAFEIVDTDLVGCLDADSFMEPGALMHIVRTFHEHPELASVTPSIKIHNPRTLTQFIQKAEYGLSVFIRRTFSWLDALFIPPGPGSFFRTAILAEIGPWREGHSTEDLELGLRLQSHHHRIGNEPRAVVHTNSPKNLYRLYRQRVRWTYGYLRNAGDYRHLFFNKHYGDLGLLILPMGAVAIVTALFVFAMLIWNAALFLIEQVVKLQAVGITAHTPKFDLFYVNTSSIIVMTVAIIILTATLLLLGKKLSKERGFALDVPLYLAVYGLIAPWWLTTAVIKAARRSEVAWR